MKSRRLLLLGNLQKKKNKQRLNNSLPSLTTGYGLWQRAWKCIRFVSEPCVFGNGLFSKTENKVLASWVWLLSVGPKLPNHPHTALKPSLWAKSRTTGKQVEWFSSRYLSMLSRCPCKVFIPKICDHVVKCIKISPEWWVWGHVSKQWICVKSCLLEAHFNHDFCFYDSSVGVVF